MDSFLCLNFQVNTLFLVLGNVVNFDKLPVILIVLSQSVFFLVDVLVEPPEHSSGYGSKDCWDTKYPSNN
jgi:hypothetical protein